MTLNAEELINRLIAQQGNTVAAAATLGTDASTLWKWKASVLPLRGPTLVAVKAILKHPEDYTDYLKLVRPAHRPAGGD